MFDSLAALIVLLKTCKLNAVVVLLDVAFSVGFLADTGPEETE